MYDALLDHVFPFLLQQTIDAWRLAFLIAAATYAVFNTIFLIFGSGEVQPWNTHWITDENDDLRVQKIQQQKQDEENKT